MFKSELDTYIFSLDDAEVICGAARALNGCGKKLRIEGISISLGAYHCTKGLMKMACLKSLSNMLECQSCGKGLAI